MFGKTRTGVANQSEKRFPDRLSCALFQEFTNSGVGDMKDLTGMKFGRLTVMRHLGSNRHKKSVWLCQCDCGNEKEVIAGQLISGKTQSCGCLQRDKVRETGRSNKRHGLCRTSLWRVWHNMRERCNNFNHYVYNRYGGRGISVCQEWQDSFEAFCEWANLSGYRHGLTLDRKDNDGNYCPENCRWATMKEQQRNRSTNRTHEGKCISEWAEIVGIDRLTIGRRLRAGWTWDEALNTPVGGARR